MKHGFCLIAILIILLGGSLMHCSATQKPIRDVAIKVAADACQEVATAEGLDPDMVELLCDDGSQIVKVLLPRQQWKSIKARGLIDGGPGI